MPSQLRHPARQPGRLRCGNAVRERHRRSGRWTISATGSPRADPDPRARAGIEGSRTHVFVCVQGTQHRHPPDRARPRCHARSRRSVVRADRDHIRVMAQLVDASTGYHVWSQTYDPGLGDIFKLQNELAIAIAQTLTPGMHAASTVAGASSPTTNVEAYRLYLQANAIVGATEANLMQAMGLYDQAIALDPNFARALSSRATTRMALLLFGLPVPGGVDAAEVDAKQALKLDPGFWGAHACACLRSHRARPMGRCRSRVPGRSGEGAERSGHPHQSRDVPCSVGHLQDSLRASERAHELAPLAPGHREPAACTHWSDAMTKPRET